MTSSLLALMSMAQNTVIIAGNNGIDLSIGAIASFYRFDHPFYGNGKHGGSLSWRWYWP